MEYSIVPIERWPEGWDRTRPPHRSSPFSAPWPKTLQLLETELDHLNAKQVTIQVDLTRDDFRLDGNLRTAARINYPGVIIGFDTTKFGGLSYPCNTFGGTVGAAWKENVRAIALGLEALRRVERYGIAQRGQQYAGFAQLGAGMAISSMSEAKAWEILLDAAGVDACPTDTESIEWLFREAAKNHHPDIGGDDAAFALLVEARDRLAS